MIRPWVSTALLTLSLVTISWAGPHKTRHLAPHRVGQQFGYSAKRGRMVIAPRFDMVTPFRQERAAVMVEGKWGFIDVDGILVGEARYDWIHPDRFDDGPALVSADGLYGYVGRDGQEVIPVKLEQATAYVGGFACIWDSQAMMFGIVDDEGLPVTGFRYEECDPSFHNGLARVRKGQRWGYVNRDGFVVRDFLYSRAEPYSEGLALVESGGLRYFMDVGGRKAIPANMPDVGSFRDGRARVKLGANRVGFIDTRGRHVVVPGYEDARDFSNGVAWVKQPRGGWQLIDRKGVALTEAHYSHPGAFSEGLCLAQRDGKYGFVDVRGREVVPFRFESVGAFRGGLAMVASRRGGKQGAVSIDGELLVDEIYHQVAPLADGMAQVTSCRWQRQGALGPETQVCDVFYVDHEGRERR